MNVQTCLRKRTIEPKLDLHVIFWKLNRDYKHTIFRSRLRRFLIAETIDRDESEELVESTATQLKLELVN